jgi:hypothetical protein
MISGTVEFAEKDNPRELFVCAGGRSLDRQKPSRIVFGPAASSARDVTDILRKMH